MKADIGQMEFIDSTLRKIVVWLEKETGLEFTATSIYRIGDTGVHGQLPVRGIDLRMHDEAIGESIEELINSIWQYDTERPDKVCAILHNVNNQGLHLHVQSHPNTIKLQES